MVVNPTLVAPAGTIAEEGVETAELLLLRPTLRPPLGAAPLSVAVHAFVPLPVMDELAQERDERVGDVEIPAADSRMVVGLPDEELLLTVSFPLTDPAAVGLNWTFNETDAPGFNVVGKEAPLTE